jgi:hypothetical protein
VVEPGKKASNSRVVQDALRCLLREHEAHTAAMAGDAILDRARFEAALTHVKSGAVAEFERGYLAGLELAEELGFEGINILASWASFQIDHAIADEQIFSEPAQREQSAWLGKYLWEFDRDTPTGFEAFRAGAERAIEDLWNALRADAWGTRNPEDGTDPELDVTAELFGEVDADHGERTEQAGAGERPGDEQGDG